MLTSILAGGEGYENEEFQGLYRELTDIKDKVGGIEGRVAGIEGRVAGIEVELQA